MWHKWQLPANSGWSAWESLGGVLTGNPAAGANADGRLEVFARGTDGALWHKWQNRVFAAPAAIEEPATEPFETTDLEPAATTPEPVLAD